MAFKTMKEVRKYLDELHRKLQEVPDGNFFKLADKLGLDVLRDFAKSDLRNTDLSNGNLENADLSHANLSNANLSGANLKNANLSHAILLKADLSGADLSGANLLNAALQDTNFSETKYNSATKFPEDFSPLAQRMVNLESLGGSEQAIAVGEFVEYLDRKGITVLPDEELSSGKPIFVYEVEGLHQNEQTEDNWYPVRNSSNILIHVPYSQIKQEMRRITRLGGKIVNISLPEDQATLTARAPYAEP